MFVFEIAAYGGGLGLVLNITADMDKIDKSHLNSTKKLQRKMCEIGWVVCELLSTQFCGPSDMNQI
ncbi:MAG TPA: hypothetical protein VFY41_08060 [Nitrososphaeraceae archaeon]|nr:hypothetical protein [Nitrososphaeraceae archaeon]